MNLQIFIYYIIRINKNNKICHKKFALDKIVINKEDEETELLKYSYCHRINKRSMIIFIYFIKIFIKFFIKCFYILI